MEQRPSFFLQPVIHTKDGILLDRFLIIPLSLFRQHHFVDLTGRVHPVEFLANKQGGL